MAELADALRSGRSEDFLMWVQVPPSALTHGDSLKSEFFVGLIASQSYPNYANFEENREVFEAKKGGEEWYNCTKSSTCFFN